MSNLLYDNSALKTALYNAIMGWYNHSLEQYNGLDDMDFINLVCEETGITKEDYAEIMFA